MWAFWVKASFYKDNTTLKEIKDGQLAASLFLFIKINKPNKNKQAQVLFPHLEKKRDTYMQVKWKYQWLWKVEKW